MSKQKYIVKVFPSDFIGDTYKVYWGYSSEIENAQLGAKMSERNGIREFANKEGAIPFAEKMALKGKEGTVYKRYDRRGGFIDNKVVMMYRGKLIFADV